MFWKSFFYFKFTVGMIITYIETVYIKSAVLFDDIMSFWSDYQGKFINIITSVLLESYQKFMYCYYLWHMTWYFAIVLLN